ncbi:hypothetical protein ABTN81_20040, partial [Acinetobacter baumannii]
LAVVQTTDHTWLSDVLGYKFNYHPSTFIRPQIKFLQYLHQKVNQKITYNCKNSVAIDSDDEKSIKLAGFDDSTLSTKGK